MAALVLATLQRKQWPCCSSATMALQRFVAMVELVAMLVEVTSGATLQFASAIRNVATLRRYCTSQRGVTTTYSAALLHLATQRCCCGAVAARSATLLELATRRCCSSQRDVAATLLELATRRYCGSVAARRVALLQFVARHCCGTVVALFVTQRTTQRRCGALRLTTQRCCSSADCDTAIARNTATLQCNGLRHGNAGAMAAAIAT